MGWKRSHRRFPMALKIRCQGKVLGPFLRGVVQSHRSRGPEWFDSQRFTARNDDAGTERP